VLDEVFEAISDPESDEPFVIRVHVQPGAGRSAVVGKHGNALKVRVAAPPVEGRANTALLGLLAHVLGVKETDLELASGESSRTKRVRVQGLPVADARRLLEDAVAAGNAPGGRGVRGSAH
jgi:uncharacterized protein (TIGR00251 family)